jgi:phosphohistidine phosphatase
MKQLFLVRHAKSSWSEPGKADHERPLADRGVRDSQRVFSRLRDHGTAFDSIVTSDAVRAKNTAERLRQTLGNDQAPRQQAQLYDADFDDILAVVHALPDHHASVALVGHNPGLTYASNKLVADLSIDNLPTCGIVGMEFPATHWREIDIGGGTLIYFDYPKNSGPPLLSSATDS